MRGKCESNERAMRERNESHKRAIRELCEKCEDKPRNKSLTGQVERAQPAIVLLEVDTHELSEAVEVLLHAPELRA